MAAVAATMLLAVGAAAIELVGEGDYVVRHAARLAELPGVAPEDLNNHAWFIAIDPDSTHEQLEAALLLAERAVTETDAAEASPGIRTIGTPSGLPLRSKAAAPAIAGSGCSSACSNTTS